jgi:hypothetical protein
MRKANPFTTIIKNLNRKDGLLAEAFIEEHYQPWAMNRVFARTPDGLLVVYDLNSKKLTKYEHYRALYHLLSKNPRRFGEKVEVEKPKYLKMVMEYYDFSKEKAHTALTILTKRELQQIEKFLDKGGIQNE